MSLVEQAVDTQPLAIEAFRGVYAHPCGARIPVTEPAAVARCVIEAIEAGEAGEADVPRTASGS